MSFQSTFCQCHIPGPYWNEEFKKVICYKCEKPYFDSQSKTSKKIFRRHQKRPRTIKIIHQPQIIPINNLEQENESNSWSLGQTISNFYTWCTNIFASKK